MLPRPDSLSLRWSPRWHKTLAAILLLASIAAVYHSLLHGGFIWDDVTYITGSPVIQAKDGLWAIWTQRQTTDFWPLSYTLYWVEWHLLGQDPLGYHLVGIFLHAMNALLLWHLLKRLGSPVAYGAALLFAVHPVTLESVGWIIEAKTTLSAFLALSAAALYLRENRTPWAYAASLLCFVLAMLAKAAVAPWPACILLAQWWQKRERGLAKADFLAILPLVAVSLTLTAANLAWYHGPSMMTVPSEVVREDGWLSRLAIGGRAFWFYLSKGLVPRDLAFIYPRWPVVDPPDLAALSPLLLLGFAYGLILIVAAYRPPLRGPAALFTYILLMLAPVLGPFEVYQMRYTFVTDHWQYYALMGTMVMVAQGVYWISRSNQFVTSLTLGALALTFGWIAHGYTQNYRDEETMWRATLKENPDSWMVHKTLGLVLKQKGHTEEAMAHYQKAIELKPQAESYYNLALIYEQLDKPREAADLYQKALALNPYRWPIYNNLGGVLARLGDHQAAAQAFARSLALEDNPIGHYNLSLTLRRLGDLKGADEHLKKAQSQTQDPQLMQAIQNKIKTL